MSGCITIVLPEGERRELWPDPGDSALKLSSWLERRQLPLNTRCGQMGLCRGCEVAVETPSGHRLTRACQCRVGDLPHDLKALHIPGKSWRDHSLSGVAEFELPAGGGRRRPRPGIGLALDIGTTTVAAALWDLATGQCLGTASRANAQGRMGDNVLTRIQYGATRPQGAYDLQRELVEATLAPLIGEACRRAQIAPDEITETIAAGNTVMLHTLAGKALSGFSKYPFRPKFLKAQTWGGEELGLPYAFNVRTPPCPSAFVGADITAGAMASGMLLEDAPALLIDFGTNGEILLKHAGGLLTTATAVGPAFEGGRLSCGATAGPGVASHVAFHEGAWELLAGAAERQPDKGLSGAAYIDFLALARRHGLLGEMGRFTALAQAEGTDERRIHLSKHLFVTEADIAEIQQAKAAILAGVVTLLELAGLEARDLGRIYIAGGFGYHLNLTHAVEIGLLPNVPPERYCVIGNGSLGGASMMLLADDVNPPASFAACQMVELNQCESFEDHYIDCMALSPR